MKSKQSIYTEGNYESSAEAGPVAIAVADPAADDTEGSWFDTTAVESQIDEQPETSAEVPQDAEPQVVLPALPQAEQVDDGGPDEAHNDPGMHTGGVWESGPGSRSWVAGSLVAGGVLTVLAFAILALTNTQGVWIYEFLLERSFVQWATISLFMMGGSYLVFYVVPMGVLERRALKGLGTGGCDSHPSRKTSVCQYWHAFCQARKKIGGQQLDQLAASLLEGVKARYDSRHRWITDTIQVLPLVGFFGTVLGLSAGLYRQFVVGGEASTEGFAGALSTAFDTTLLALALTIVLYIVHGIVRKRDEGVVLELERVTRRELDFHTTELPDDIELRQVQALEKMAEFVREFGTVADFKEEITQSVQGATVEIVEQLIADNRTLAETMAAEFHKSMQSATGELLRSSAEAMVKAGADAGEAAGAALEAGTSRVVDQLGKSLQDGVEAILSQSRAEIRESSEQCRLEAEQAMQNGVAQVLSGLGEELTKTGQDAVAAITEHSREEHHAALQSVSAEASETFAKALKFTLEEIAEKAAERDETTADSLRKALAGQVHDATKDMVSRVAEAATQPRVLTFVESVDAERKTNGHETK